MNCCKPIIPFFEFEISEDIFIPNSKDTLPIIPETDISFLKEKVICEYLAIITALERGQKPNLEFLLEEISLIDIEKEINNREFVIQYYLNNQNFKNEEGF